MIKRTGLGTPFINVSFSGLLWGYKDELPCVNHARPEHCPPPPGEEDIFADDGDDDDGWDFRRRKRSVAEADTASGRERREAEAASGEVGQTPGELRDLDFASLEKPKAELVDCKCEWGLFRDRNVTLRKPLKVHHGVDDVSRKGWLEEFDGSDTLGWWEPGSECDAVAGQDSSTLPPWPDRTKPIQMFISLMCRSIRLDWEQDTEHAGLTSARFVPLPSALGSPTDPDPTRANPANQCYCREGFSCYKTGVLNMAPCKTRPDLPLGAPIALSYPHFYQADPSYLGEMSVRHCIMHNIYMMPYVGNCLMCGRRGGGPGPRQGAPPVLRGRVAGVWVPARHPAALPTQRRHSSRHRCRHYEVRTTDCVNTRQQSPGMPV